MDKETKQAIENIHSGNLAAQINNNMRFSITGIFIGWGIAMMVASLFGQSKIIFGIGGAIAGGTIGKLTANQVNKKNK